MLVGLCGGICAGKESVANYLVNVHGFNKLIVSSELQQLGENIEIPQAVHDNPQPASTLAFQSIGELIDFVTPRWRELWVITNICDNTALEKLLLRPFFLLLRIDAPITLRWRRFTDRCRQRQLAPPDLEKFLLLNDWSLYGIEHGATCLMDRAHLRVLNSSSSVPELHAALDSIDILNARHLRPIWDQYFMQLASLAAKRSNCMKRRVGCVLVKNNRIISTGYNGTPRNTKNCNEGGCPRCNLGQGSGAILSSCLCLHAEENALLEAGRERIGEGTILYCDTCPCLTCSVKIVQLGITEVVYSQSYHMDKHTAAILKDAGVHLRQFSDKIIY